MSEREAPTLSTHVLDTALGLPARGVAVRLDRLDRPQWTTLALGATDADGRLRFSDADLAAGTYRLVFDTGAYHGPDAFFPEVTVAFTVTEPQRHHHVPLLLSPFSYSTYRGS